MSSTKTELPSPTRILIVEDDDFYAQYMDEMLRDEGVEVTKASTAEEALASDAQSFDGAVIDVMLPNAASATGITAEESRGGFATGVAVARRLHEIMGLRHPSRNGCFSCT
jgi:CheY-like chemotaxis protein